MTSQYLAPYLILHDPDGKPIAETKDENGDRASADLSIRRLVRLYGTLPQDGTYTLVVNARQRGEMGTYSLLAKTPISIGSQ